MTAGQMTLSGLGAAGAALFLGGRHLARRLSRGDGAFLPASLATWRGTLSYALTLVAWGGAALAAACLAILLG